MNKRLARLPVILKAARELGPRQAAWYVLYQFGLRSGHYRRVTPTGAYQPAPYPIHSPYSPEIRARLTAGAAGYAGEILSEANEVANGQVRLFGGPLVPLQLAPPNSARHWTFYEGRPTTWGVEDIKYLWEPARFGWAYPLGRAYLISGDERYPAAFWQHLETFLQANPPNQGPNWSSAQEVALRMLALTFAAGVFRESAHSTPSRLALLSGVIAAHALRIDPTLPYARAQNNNHLISEALGLYTAGCTLPDHPLARDWRESGTRLLNQTLLRQIHPDGTYVQHSMNYHRLMLHAALQAHRLACPFSPPVLDRLKAAATWLLAQVDPISGGAPNLGHNDGANILPLAPGGFGDYRPTAQAAALAFLGRPALLPGPWDELCTWLNLTAVSPSEGLPSRVSQAVRVLGDATSWGTLRAVRFSERPAHADQLHVDLWWQGENVALDAGTFRYTAPVPWDNALAETRVHNTVEVGGLSQMQRAGRFLWLDWAQASRVDPASEVDETIAAQHNGYRRLGVIHRRSLKRIAPDQWQVTDDLFNTGGPGPLSRRACTFRLHWLLPDWPYHLDGARLTLDRPGGGTIDLRIEAHLGGPDVSRLEYISLVRAGQALAGPETVSPTLGWRSPTYGVKIPALSLTFACTSALPLTLVSNWAFWDSQTADGSNPLS